VGDRTDLASETSLGEQVDFLFFNGYVDDVAAKLIGCFLFAKNKNKGHIGGQIIEASPEFSAH
jgi:hypothetical protein